KWLAAKCLVSAFASSNQRIARSARSGRKMHHARHISSGSVKCVCLFEQPHGLSHVVATFLQGLWIPFAALDSEEIPTVDVNGAGQPINGISHRVNDVVPEGISIFRG